MNYWQIFYYGLGAAAILITGLTVAIKYGIAIVQYFTRLELKLDILRNDVNVILTNHLPHIYQRLGEEKLEVRQDSVSVTRGNRDYIQQFGPDPLQPGISDGGQPGSVADHE